MKNIRGHHLFCMALFSGHGYDEHFAENMGRLIETFRAGEGFRLCTGQDAVCAACPNKRPNGGCSLGTGDVLRRDSAAQDVLKLAPGQELDWAGVMGRLAMLNEKGFQSVCGGCRWAAQGLCCYELLHKRAAENAAKPEDTLSPGHRQPGGSPRPLP